MSKSKKLTPGQLRRRRKRAVRKAKRRAMRRARWEARWRKIVHELTGPKIIATTRENAPATRVRVTKRPVVMHQVHTTTDERMTNEHYRAAFAHDGRRSEIEFELHPDSPKEIRKAAYEAAEIQEGPATRGWYLIKVEGTNALGKEMLK